MTFYNADDLLVLIEWNEVADELAKLKAREAELRKQVTGLFFNLNGELKEGTNNVPLAQNHVLKAVFKINYSVDSADKVDEALTKIESAGVDGKFIAERLFSWKPTLSVSEYKKLTPEYKKIVDEVITTSQGSTTLQIVKPK